MPAKSEVSPEQSSVKTEPAFTPGPWKADTTPGCKRISDKPWVDHQQARRREIACTSGLRNDNEDAANGHLIAAAPELYEALGVMIWHSFTWQVRQP